MRKALRLTGLLVAFSLGALFILATSSVAASDDRPTLMLPWEVGQSWNLTQGPHNTYGGETYPKSSLDFAGGDFKVRAAGSGIVSRFTGCANENLVQIEHTNGYMTRYYHLKNIQVSNG